MIPFLNLKAVVDDLRLELDVAYNRFMDSGSYVLGQEVLDFETEFADYCQAEFCIGVGSGLDALALGLRAMDVGPGDEVIVPSNTYIATWLAVSAVGAKIVPVEPDPRFFNITLEAIAPAVTRKTRAILPVNLYGQPIDYDPIVDFASSRGIATVVDNAQGHGAKYRGRSIGAIADVECHSFYPTKNLGALGEAGAITTNSPNIADKIKVMRNYGSRKRYHNEICGTNSRLDALQAAFLRVKLKHLDAWNARRTAVAAEYELRLEGASGLALPKTPDWSTPAWHLFVVRHSSRDRLADHLAAAGIQTLVHYPIPPHLSGAYKSLGFLAGSFPIAEELAESVLSLPCNPFLELEDITIIADVLVDACSA